MTKPSSVSAPVSVRGRVEAIYYSKQRFSVGRMLAADGTALNFAGALMVAVNDQVVLAGKWVDHPKYGRQLEVSNFTFDQDLDADGLAQYLANHKDIKGIGDVKAKYIAHAFGKDFDRVIEHEPERVAEVAKVSAAVVAQLRSVWLQNRAFNSTALWLASFGLTHHQVNSLTTRYGNSAVTMLKEDPYLLIDQLPGFGFRRVDLVARKLGAPIDGPRRLRAGILSCISERIEEGDCWVDYMELIELANKVLAMDTEDSRVQIEEVLERLVDEKRLVCVSIDGRLLVARPDLARQEHDIAELLRLQVGANPHDTRGALRTQAAELAGGLNEGQRRALLATAEHNLVLISGPGGSGKTHLVASVCRMYTAAGKQVVLAAPTGKAAKRLEQVVGREALTLHRLLGFNGRFFECGPGRPLRRYIEADVVIVDEVSMVDVPLAWQLLGAIDFARTAVVLVGDHNQLPPVGPGNLLRDLVERRPLPTVILDQVVRQAGVLKENSTAILAGEIRKTAAREADGRSPWIVVNKHTEATTVQEYILWLFKSVLHEHLHFDLLRDVQLLTPQRKGVLGVDELNIALQRVLQKKLFDVDVEHVAEGRRPKLLVHDRVIQTRNNYDLQVMNGAVGIVTAVGPKPGRMVVQFEGRAVEYGGTQAASAELQLAFALTTHRAQGSEFPCAVVVAHKAHSYMQHRNILYTAVTRAQKVAVIVGDAWGMRECATKVQVQKRSTFLSVLELPPPYAVPTPCASADPPMALV